MGSRSPSHQLNKRLYFINQYQGLIICLIWVAFAARVVNLGQQSLWRDEVDTILFAHAPFEELVSDLARQGHNGPLYFILIRLWLTIMGNSEFSVRYPSALLGIIAVPLSLILVRQLRFSHRAALLTSCLLATSPYLVWYGQEAKMYTLLVALVLMAIIALLKAITQTRRTWWAIFVVITSISFYIHILAPLTLLIYATIVWLHRKELSGRWRSWWISLGYLTIPYLPLIIWQLPLFIAGNDSGHPFYPLLDQISVMLRLYTVGLVQNHGLVALTLFIFLLLSGLFLFQGKKKQRLLLTSWLILPTLTIHLISWRVAVFEDRYLIYVTPAFYLIVVLGLLSLRHHSHFMAATCLGGVLLFNLLSISVHQNQPIKPDFRAAAEHIHQASPTSVTVMVLIPYLQHTFRYYYPHEGLTLLEGLWTNNRKSMGRVDKEMTQLTECISELWLVVSEETLWDQRGLTRKWLDEQANLMDQAEFQRVTVYRYQFGVTENDSMATKNLPHNVYLPLVTSNQCEILEQP